MTTLDAHDDRHSAAAAAALEELRRRHAALIDAIPDFVWLKDLDGRFLAVNAAFAAYLRHDPRDVVGRLDVEIFPPALVARFQEQERHVVEHDVVLVVEEEVTLPGGATSWFETVKAPFRDATGRITATVGATRDVTRRRMAEEPCGASSRCSPTARCTWRARPSPSTAPCGRCSAGPRTRSRR